VWRGDGGGREFLSGSQFGVALAPDVLRDRDIGGGQAPEPGARQHMINLRYQWDIVCDKHGHQFHGDNAPA
jgi:hypothetical protein